MKNYMQLICFQFLNFFPHVAGFNNAENINNDKSSYSLFSLEDNNLSHHETKTRMWLHYHSLDLLGPNKTEPNIC